MGFGIRGRVQAPQIIFAVVIAFPVQNVEFHGQRMPRTICETAASEFASTQSAARENERSYSPIIILVFARCPAANPLELSPCLCPPIRTSEQLLRFLDRRRWRRSSPASARQPLFADVRAALNRGVAGLRSALHGLGLEVA